MSAVVDQDLGFEAMTKGLKKLDGLTLTIGYQGDDGGKTHNPEKGRATIAEVAAFQEFGTENAPERPSLRTAFEEKKAEVSTAFNKAINEVIDGKKPDRAFRKVGAVSLKILRDRIRTAKRWAAPLAPSTIKRKGHDRPLRETDVMLEATSWAVRRDGQIIKEGK